MIDLCELDRIGEEVAVTYFEVIVWSSPEGLRISRKNSVRIFISASLKPRASRM
jgi:hypothetical protein